MVVIIHPSLGNLKIKIMKYKFVYDITHPTKFGIGCQPMKGNTKAEARVRFKKKFPKKSIIGIDKRESPLHSWNKAL